MGSLQNGDIMCRFSMACNDHHVNIVMWREMAEIAEKYLKKGSRVYISGMITTSTWDESGITEIIAESMQKLDNEF